MTMRTTEEEEKNICPKLKINTSKPNTTLCNSLQKFWTKSSTHLIIEKMSENRRRQPKKRATIMLNKKKANATKRNRGKKEVAARTWYGHAANRKFISKTYAHTKSKYQTRWCQVSPSNEKHDSNIYMYTHIEN